MTAPVPDRRRLSLKRPTWVEIRMATIRRIGGGSEDGPPPIAERMKDLGP